MKNTDTLLSLMVPFHVKVERVKDLLCTAIEGGSAGWVKSLDRMGGLTTRQAEYRQDVPFVEGGWLELVELDEDRPHAQGRTFRIDLKAIQDGLATFALKYPKSFADFVNENEDAGTADTFLQCCCFGEEVYG